MVDFIGPHDAGSSARSPSSGTPARTYFRFHASFSSSVSAYLSPGRVPSPELAPTAMADPFAMVTIEVTSSGKMETQTIDLPQVQFQAGG